MSLDLVENAVLEFINGSDSRLTFNDIKKHLNEKYGFERLLIKKAVNSLLNKNEIVYTYNLGNTFLEISYNKPVRIGKRFVLIPENCKTSRENDEDIYIKLQKGASFGTGSHPTTRMSLKGIEYVFEKRGCFDCALDIGTGSGVLAIGAALSGVNRVYATDLSDIALSEAQKNISFNGLSEKITTGTMEPDEIGEKISLLMANLRYPTLISLYKTFMDISNPESFFVFSGIRPDEADGLTEKYSGCSLLKRWDEIGWSGLVFLRD